MWILVPNKILSTYEWKIKSVDLEANPERATVDNQHVRLDESMSLSTTIHPA